jgi:hypothetical protein
MRIDIELTAEQAERLAKRNERKRETRRRWLAKPGNRERMRDHSRRYRSTEEGQIAHRELSRLWRERKKAIIAPEQVDDHPKI